MKKLYTYYYNYPVISTEKCIFDRFSCIYNCLLSDRFNFLNQFSKWNFEQFEDKLPSINTKLNYKDICLERAQEIANQYPDGIAIAYSGGVDSTGILALLLMVGYPTNKIRLVGNKYSLIENDFVYNYCLKNKINLTISEPGQFCQHFHNLNEKVIVFGGCNDQFFHIGSVYKNLDKQLIPLQDSLKWLYKKSNILSYLDKDLDIINQYANLINWEVKDLFDLSVLLNFGCRYTFIQNHLPLQTLSKETQNKVINFYDNQDFQDWALTNKEKNKEHYKLSLMSNFYYKPELKQIIDEVFHNRDYLMNKGKEGSWIKIMNDKQEKWNVPIIYSVKDKEGISVRWFKNTKLKNHNKLKEIGLNFFKDYLKNTFIEV